MTEREQKKKYICATCYGEFDTFAEMEEHWRQIKLAREKGAVA